MSTHAQGIIKSRPNAQKNLGSTTTGLREMGLETEQDGFLYVPDSFNPKKPSALFVVLHPAKGTAQQSVDLMKAHSDRTGTILVAPQAQAGNWDVLNKGFGTDVEMLDEALSDVFALYPIDTQKIAVGGVAEGADYAMALASKNADLFTHIIGIAPNKPVDAKSDGPTRVFVAKADEDKKTSIERAFTWFLGH